MGPRDQDPGRNGHTNSLPDHIYDRTTRRARALGISRSEFFARAAERYADELEDASLTSQIDAAIDHGAVDDSSDWAVEAGHRLVSPAQHDERW